MLAWIRGGLELFVDSKGVYWLPALAVGLWLAGRRRPPHPLRGVVLAAAAAFALLVYLNFFNFHYGGFVNRYEFYHYYMGAKYAPEVGYFDLYNATLIADEETGRMYRPPDDAISDLTTYKYFHVDYVRSNAERYRAPFSADRWRAFTADVEQFKRGLGPAAWNRILQDKGYNATPVWTLAGGGLANLVRTDGLFLLALLDPLLWLLAGAAIGRTYGWPTAGFALLLLATSFFTAGPHLKGAFLRTDFVVALVLAICAVRKQRYGWAGAAVAWAALSRLFPAVFLFGAGAAWFWSATRTRRWRQPRYERFFLAAGGTALALLAATLVFGGGVERWRDYAAKMALHRAEHHMWNVGLPALTIADFANPLPLEGVAPGIPLPPAARDGAEIRPTVGEQRTLLLRLLQVAGLAAALWAARGLRDDRALAFGFVPLYLLVAPTYYYYVLLLVPLLYFAAEPRGRGALVGVPALYAIGAAGFAFYARWDQWYPTYFWLSALLLLLCVWSVADAVQSNPTGGASVQ